MKDLKFILSYLKYYKKDLFITLALVVVETFFELIIPFLMSDIIDKGIEMGDTKQIWISGSLIVACALISLITGHFYAVSNARLVTKFSYRLRGDVFEKIQTYSFANIDHFESASLITRVTNDVQIMQNTLAGGLRPICRSPIMLLMGVGLSFAMAPSIAWVFLCAIPVLGTILFIVVRKTAPKYSVIQKSIDNVNLVVRENINAIRTVKSYVREEHEKEKFNKANTKVMDVTKFTFKVAQLNQPSFQLVMYAVTVLILYLGSIAIHKSTLGVGTLSALLSYILQVLNSLMMVSNVFLLVNRSFASSSRICEIFREVPTIKNNPNGLKNITNGAIDFNNVSFKYKENSIEYVLSDINLHIAGGKSVGILGGTGSAKSTLVALILRLYDVTKGEVLIDGQNVKDYDLKYLRDNISIVLQNNVLFSGTVRDNLKWGNKNATDEQIYDALKKSCADEFIDRLPGGLDYDLGQGGVNVSGGQKQRLCIARALLKNPKIIIFDDSTSACDMETERKILTNIRNLHGLTNIIIAQRITSVMGADMIIIIDNGKIQDIGNHEELLSRNEIYQELYETQLGGVVNAADSQ